MTRDLLLLVNYNGEKILPECLTALARQTRMPGEVLIIDNGSRDHSVALIRREFPWVTVIETGKNLGFAGGNNFGVRARPDAKIITLLNTDTRPEPGWYAALIAPLEAGLDTPPSTEKPVAITWSNVVPPGTESARRTFRSSISPLGYTVRNVGAENFIFYASGSAMAYRRDLLGEPFLDDYFMYYEDLQLSWRARLCGYDIRRVAEAEVLHYGSVTTRRYRSRKTLFYQQRNRLLTLLISYEWGTLLRLWPLLEIDFWFNLLLGVAHPGRSALAFLDAWLWILKHAGKVRTMREQLQRARRVPDAELLSLMSPGPTSTSPRFMSSLIRTLCRLVGINLECGDPAPLCPPATRRG